ncbi:MAG: multiheme c-type cytochrome [Cyclobacteriaceae bacterium]
MEKTPSGIFQRGFVDGLEVNKKPFDLVIGSGRQGQTYLYWQDNSLLQLPVSYYSARDAWSNSPGYPPDQIIFNRSITARCLECHSTYFKIEKAIGDRETFDRNQVMLGVDCERCHGPAADHVKFHLKHPAEKQAQHVINPARLTRQQKLDNCALCHSGIRDNIMPSFSYIVGDNLDDFSFPGYTVDSAATLDVHGNQYGLLTASKCFRMSAMDCSSCHNVHAKETNKLEIFSSRCMSCHAKGSDNFCKQREVHGLVLSKNCIDCHMPALPSRQVFLQASDSSRSTPFFVRTHLVGTYEARIKSFLEKIESENSPLR